jgi:hypothetical protein
MQTARQCWWGCPQMQIHIHMQIQIRYRYSRVSWVDGAAYVHLGMDTDWTQPCVIQVTVPSASLLYTSHTHACTQWVSIPNGWVWIYPPTYLPAHPQAQSSAGNAAAGPVEVTTGGCNKDATPA